ncbi:MAG: PKD domain-containing protein [Saprospiraceae bacterium]
MVIDWGDETIDTVYTYNNVTHIYNFQGIDRCEEGPIFNQEFCYIGYKSCGNGYSCNYASGVVSVRLKPVAIFDTEEEICIEDLAAFSNVSCNAQTYFWDFGDGTTSIEENPDHRYTQAGRYTVRLEATNQCGTDIMTKIVNVIDLPDADAIYDLNPTTGCLPLTVTFTNNSATNNRGSQGVTWEFSPSSGWNYTDTIYHMNSFDNEVRFTQAGTYDVTLTMTNICGEDSWTDSIVVLERPRVNLSNIGSYCLDQGPVTIDFCDFTTYTGSIFGYTWTITDTDGNLVFNSNQQCPSHTFASPGNFTALIQVDGGPCGNIEDQISFSVQEPGNIEFQGIPSIICNKDSIFQINVSPLGGSWTGSNAINQNSEFDPIIAGVGTHSLTYNVGSGACNTSKSLSITVLQVPSVVLDSIGPACQQINYSPQVSYQGEVSSYSWSFQNGTPTSSNQPNPSGILFNTNDPHLIKIEVDGNCGIAQDSFY